MALTPEDVVNKRFQHVKFRDGYDQDEVDDFLDEVVVELRRLNQENDELRQKLSAAQARVSELEAGSSNNDPNATVAMPAAAPAPQETPAEKKDDKAPVVAPQTPAAQPAPEAPARAAEAEEKPAAAPAQQAPAPAPTPAPAAPAAAAIPAPTGSTSAQNTERDAHGLIALAQRVHDEHVAEGESTRDRLIDEAKRKAAVIVADAQKKRDETLQQLETQKANLEKDIDGLQSFERQYRTRLKSYLADQLRELDNSGSLAPETLSKDSKHGL